MVITIFKEMKFMKKRLLSLFSVFFLLVSLFGVNINNIHAKENAEIQPRLPMCTSCFKGTITTSSKLLQEGWESHGEVKCIHGKPHGTDLIFKDLYQYTIRCSYCGIVDQYTERVDRYECHGYY